MVRQLFIWISLLLWGCASQPVATVESSLPADSNKKVLVATQNSKFKRAVVSEIYDELSQNAVYLKIIDVKGLKNQTAAKYSAVVIINRCMAGRPDPRVESFIDREPQKNKLIVLTTGMLDSWTPDAPAVDAITSASVLDKSDQVAHSIVKRVLAMVNSTGPAP
jgi:glycine cleavage system pyridoxal-binding protein P